MRRWNGWGDEKTNYPLNGSALAYLEGKIGAGKNIPDVTLDDIVSAVPASGLKGQGAVRTDPLERISHARGQSLPDWIAVRQGRVSIFPDGVAYPEADEDVRSLFAFARQNGARLIPYGGGTSVVGHINPRGSDSPTLTVDMSRMNRMLDLDEVNHLATFGAGVCGPDLEAQLQPYGFTLGHFPQSFELSTLGGWIAARSSGQQSYFYGRIENLFAGGHVETPAGILDFPSLPASAAGPDLRQMFLGSEGRFGIMTRAAVRVRLLPVSEYFYGIFFHDWQSGVAAVREIAQNHVPVSMLRLSDAQETESTLMLSGKDELVKWADHGLRLLHYANGRALMILGVTGDKASARFAYHEATWIARKRGGFVAGTSVGQIWQKSRFLSPYLRNTLWESGYAVDTLETALPWTETVSTALAVKEAIREALEKFGERVLVFAHLSHVYTDGASIYVTYVWRRSNDPDLVLDQWRAMKGAASDVIVSNGGTISHQHGVGEDHRPYLMAEKGILGLEMIEAARASLDPERILNPGKLVE
jgi:alkyldihydroxyacetonephosphate synthase